MYEELLKWTKGKAHKYVESVPTHRPDEALTKAKNKLLSFYAAIPRTAKEIFEPLKKGKTISQNDKEGFQMFLCDLEEAENTCAVNNDVHLLNNVDLIVDLVAAKMPKTQKYFSRYVKAGLVKLSPFRFSRISSVSRLRIYLCLAAAWLLIKFKRKKKAAAAAAAALPQRSLM